MYFPISNLISEKFPCRNKIIKKKTLKLLFRFQIFLNPTLYGGWHSVQWHNSYMTLRIGFMRRKIQIFFKFIFTFFLVIWTPFTHKKFFCTFGPKITNFYILEGQHVHLTPPKMLFRGLNYKLSSKRPSPPWLPWHSGAHER